MKIVLIAIAITSGCLLVAFAGGIALDYWANFIDANMAGWSAYARTAAVMGPYFAIWGFVGALGAILIKRRTTA